MTTANDTAPLWAEAADADACRVLADGGWAPVAVADRTGADETAVSMWVKRPDDAMFRFPSSVFPIWLDGDDGAEEARRLVAAVFARDARAQSRLRSRGRGKNRRKTG